MTNPTAEEAVTSALRRHGSVNDGAAAGLARTAIAAHNAWLAANPPPQSPEMAALMEAVDAEWKFSCGAFFNFLDPVFRNAVLALAKSRKGGKG